MAGDADKGADRGADRGNRPGAAPQAARRGRAPEWTDGLKQFYDAVVEEELPDSFRDLLARLDEIDPARGMRKADGGGSGAGPGEAR